jgi:hypothetical protein
MTDTAKKNRPILFSAPMVRALLDGSKTQTRRVAKIKRVDAHPQNPIIQVATMEGAGKQFWANSQISHPNHISKACPHGQVDDQLWVRETFMDMRATGVDYNGNEQYAYRADISTYGEECRKDYGLKWKPSIFMPRAASRITLEITGVRVERLQDISRGDCMAEGCPFPNYAKVTHPEKWYRDLWESINGAGSWDLNPWVWVVEFKKVKP